MIVDPSRRYVETTPVGPHDDGSRAPDQIGRGYHRRFVRRLPDEGYGGYAVVTVRFHIRESTGARGPRRDLVETVDYEIFRDSADSAGTRTYHNTLTHDVDSHPDDTLDDRDALDACSRFDPAGLDWDGWPAGELDCDMVIEPRDDGRSKVAVCRTHESSEYAPTSPDDHGAASLFTCDRGRRYIFLTDFDGPEGPNPQLVDLTGLVRAAVHATEDAFYGDGGPRLTLHRYLGPGRLQPLTVRGAPGSLPTRSGGVRDDSALMIHLERQIIGPVPRPDATGDDACPDGLVDQQDPIVYATFTAIVNGDA